MPDRLFFAISRIHHRLTAYLKKELKKAGIDLSRGQIGILMVLDRDQQTSMGRLSQELEIDNAAATRLVDKLEKQTLVERQINPQDRRQMLITITKSGRKKAVIVKEIALTTNKKIEAGFTDTQIAIYKKVNQAILEKFR